MFGNKITKCYIVALDEDNRAFVCDVYDAQVEANIDFYSPFGKPRHILKAELGAIRTIERGKVDISDEEIIRMVDEHG